jgi:Ni/Fe-hydrogenase subunit HybB-like protein
VKSFRFGFVLLLLVVLGASVFLWQTFGSEPTRAWQAFLINLLFFSAIAQSGSVLAAIHHLTEARWGRSVMPVAIGLGSFLPVSFVLFLVLFAGFPSLPSYSAELPARRFWLDPLFLIGRDILGIAILYSVSLAFSYCFLTSTIRRSSNHSASAEIRGGTENMETGRERRIEAYGTAQNATPLAILVVAVYAVVFSMIGFDLVMAFDQQWYSTLFGGYFFISSFYTGLAAITVTVFLVSRYSEPNERVHTETLWDLGKLVFAFCLLTAYFFWAQYLVTWYGNLPEEIGFFMRRFQDPSWRWLTWAAIALTFAVPFLALLSQRTKQSSSVLCFVAVIALFGMWLERYLLIVPSFGLTAAPALGWTEVVITMSFLAAMVFTYRVYLQLLQRVEREVS